MADKAARIPHIFHALDLLMPKVNALPTTPGDSVQNAITAMRTMNDIGATAALDARAGPPGPQANTPNGNGNGANGQS